MKHKVTCAECGKTERIKLEKGEPISEEWHYYGKFNINGCQTSKFFYDDTNCTKKVPNRCYDPKVKKKMVELWFCKECDLNG